MTTSPVSVAPLETDKPVGYVPCVVLRESVDAPDSLKSEVASLQSEILALRSVVAHLQAYGPPVPPGLRPVIMRALLAPRRC